jgi:hypothetical protein
VSPGRVERISDGPGGRRFYVLQAAWVLVALLALAITAASAPADFERYSALCAGAPESCLERSQLTPEELREMERIGLSLGLYAAVGVGVSVLSKLVWFAVGGLVFLLRPRDKMALLVSCFLVVFGTATLASESVDVLVSVYPGWWVPARGLQVLGEVLAVLFFLTFPDGRFVPRWSPLLAAVFLTFQIPGDLFPELYSSAPPVFGTLQMLVFLACVLGMIGSQVYRYRRVSTFEQRRQTKWVVFGTTLATLLLITTLAPLFFFVLRVAETSSSFVLLIGEMIPFIMLLIPISVGIATLRSGLFDIDLVINRALIYGTLTVSLVVVYLGAVVGTQRLLSPLVGESNQLAVVVSTLVIAALFQPLRRRIRAFIDRRFYRKKYDATKMLERFGSRLREETDLDALNAELVSVVKETMQPEHVSLWLRPETPRQGEESRT